MSNSILRLDIVGRGPNLRHYDHAIVCDAGWNTDTTLDGAVLLKTTAKLRHVRIHLEFCGYVETRWEASDCTVLAKNSPSGEYQITRTGRVFQRVEDVLYDSKEPLLPNPTGGSLAFPFTLNLPKNQMPPTFNSVGGSIQYSLKCSIFFQEGLKLLKSTREVDVPVLVSIPESAKIKLLESSSQLTHQVPESFEKVGYSLQIPRRIVVLGDSLEVNLAITSTPGDTRLRYMSASLRPVISYLNQDSVGAHARIPRALSEMSQSFPLVKVGGPTGVATIYRRLLFLVDPELAQPSLESPLISVKTIFRLDITVDNSETPNVTFELPIIVVPPVRQHSLQQASSEPSQQSDRQYAHMFGSTAKPVSALDSYRISVDSRRQLGYSSPRLSSITTPILLGGNPSLASRGSGGRSSALSFRSRAFTASISSSSAVPSLTSSTLTYITNRGISSAPSLAQSVQAAAVAANASVPSPPSSSSIHPQTHFDKAAMIVSDTAMDVDSDQSNVYPATLFLPSEALLSEEESSDNGLDESSPAMSSASSSAGFDTSEVPQMDTGANLVQIYEKPSEAWSIRMVADWVGVLGASPAVVQCFIDQAIDGSVLMTLSDDDLKNELGVTVFGLRRKILMQLDRNRVAGRGSTKPSPDGGIALEGGWDVESTLDAAVVLAVNGTLKNPRIHAELRGYSETRWEGPNRLAAKAESPWYKVSRTGKLFLHNSIIVHESRMPITPNANGTPATFPFSFTMPKKNLPPSFETICGGVSYFIKIMFTFTEQGKFMKSTREYVVPVTITVPERAILKMLSIPSPFSHSAPPSDEKVGFTVKFPKKVVAIGEALQIEVTITSTPNMIRLRSLYACLKVVASYRNEQDVAHSVFSQPLAETTRGLNLARVGGSHGGDPVKMRLSLPVEAEAGAKASIESPLVSLRTMLRLQLVTDDSDTPNTSLEFPVLVLPAVTNQTLRSPSGSNSSPFLSPSVDPADLYLSPTMFPGMQPRTSFSVVSEPGTLVPTLDLPASGFASDAIATAAFSWDDPDGSLKRGPNSPPSSMYSVSPPPVQSPEMSPLRNNSNKNIHHPVSFKLGETAHSTRSAGNNSQSTTQTVRPVQSAPILNAQQSQSPLTFSSILSSQTPTAQLPHPALTGTMYKGPHYPPELPERLPTPPPTYEDPLVDFLERDNVDSHGLSEDHIFSNDAAARQQQLEREVLAPEISRFLSEFEEKNQLRTKIDTPPSAKLADTVTETMTVLQVSATTTHDDPTSLSFGSLPSADSSLASPLAAAAAATHPVTSQLPASPLDWTVEMVGRWVRGFTSEETAMLFLRHEIDGTVLMTLSADDLKTELDIQMLGTRRKISMAIDKLRLSLV
ncbi:hypothetical protein HDU81_003663 [Chytriomyces hyalinus]|nr:hypothetical protein HDU81_003663 [Chytriomyces hyalinus]